MATFAEQVPRSYPYSYIQSPKSGLKQQQNHFKNNTTYQRVTFLLRFCFQTLPVSVEIHVIHV